MAQDPEFDDEIEGQEESVDPSHGLDLVPLYSSQTIEAESEADVIRGILEANGIPSVISNSPITSLGIQIMVPRAALEDARRVVEQQRQAGPAAAEEAEAASEEK